VTLPETSNDSPINSRQLKGPKLSEAVSLDSQAQSAEALTHLDSQGQIRMVDVSAKVPSVREAIAVGEVQMRPQTLAAIVAGNMPKGDVMTVSRLAGIMAAKQTAQLIPLCHPLPLQKIEVKLTPDTTLPGYQIQALVKTTAETGVEMEALTAVSIAALTLYDMAKAIDKSMQIGRIRLLQKTGGKSGDYQAAEEVSSR